MYVPQHSELEHAKLGFVLKHAETYRMKYVPLKHAELEHAS